VQRNGDGSPKEFAMLEELIDRVYLSKEMIEKDKFDAKIVMMHLEVIVQGLNDLRSRKFVKFMIYLLNQFLEKSSTSSEK
jgi:hypothetical protein